LWCVSGTVVVLGACSNIIGISSYEIDPTLDSGGSTQGGKSASGGSAHAGSKNTGGDAGAPVGGDGPDVGGQSSGGGEAGGGGEGGSPVTPVGCSTAKDCDDTIDCTTDTCGAGHVCLHTPKDTLCDGSSCETCQAGIGCVAGDKVEMQLLLDPNFDVPAGDWDESGSDGINVTLDPAAQTPTRIAKFGPAAPAAKEQQYSDLLQLVTVPKGTVALTLTGYYKLLPGVKVPADDYLVAAMYEDGALLPFTQFHSFEATSGAKAAWTAFTYSAPKAEVADMGGLDYTFDLVAHTWDSVYRFDTLALNATVCSP
jgi:hypothetical protein